MDGASKIYVNDKLRAINYNDIGVMINYRNFCELYGEENVKVVKHKGKMDEEIKKYLDKL